MPSEKVDFDAVREIALTLSGVRESSLHGSPSLKVGGRLLACPALHKSAEPHSLVVRIGFDQRAELMKDEPGVYYVTHHYLKHPMVLVRLGRIRRKALGDLLRAAWRLARVKTTQSGRGARHDRGP